MIYSPKYAVEMLVTVLAVVRQMQLILAELTRVSSWGDWDFLGMLLEVLVMSQLIRLMWGYLDRAERLDDYKKLAEHRLNQLESWRRDYVRWACEETREAVLEGSGFEYSRPPAYQVMVETRSAASADKWVVVGQGFATSIRVGEVTRLCIVTARHVIETANARVRLTGPVGCIHVDVDDFVQMQEWDVAYLLIKQQDVSALGVSLGRLRAVRDLQHVNVSALGLTSTGMCHLVKNHAGKLAITASTRPGFSGAPYHVGKFIYGIHLAGTKANNYGVDAQLVEVLIRGDLRLDTRNESSEEYYEDLIQAGMDDSSFEWTTDRPSDPTVAAFRSKATNYQWKEVDYELFDGIYTSQKRGRTYRSGAMETLDKGIKSYNTELSKHCVAVQTVASSADVDYAVYGIEDLVQVGFEVSEPVRLEAADLGRPKTQFVQTKPTGVASELSQTKQVGLKNVSTETVSELRNFGTDPIDFEAEERKLRKAENKEATAKRLAPSYLPEIDGERESAPNSFLDVSASERLSEDLPRDLAPMLQNILRDFRRFKEQREKPQESSATDGLVKTLALQNEVLLEMSEKLESLSGKASVGADPAGPPKKKKKTHGERLRSVKLEVERLKAQLQKNSCASVKSSSPDSQA